jgi:hypothetical protein
VSIGNDLQVMSIVLPVKKLGKDYVKGTDQNLLLGVD